MNDDIIQKSIEAYELASRRDLTVNFARSSNLRSILSADEPENAEMALVIERKGIILGKGLQGISHWLPFCSIIFTSFCTDYLVLSRK